MKIIGLISDTHIPSRRKTIPDSVFSAFDNVDMILHAGDFEELGIVSILEEIAPLHAVSGNMCQREVKTRFPKKLTIKVEKILIGLTHGSGGPSGYLQRVKNEFKNEQQPKIIVSGHTHQPMAKVEGNILFINPGSPTDRYFAPRNTVALLEINNTQFQYRFIDIK